MEDIFANITQFAQENDDLYLGISIALFAFLAIKVIPRIMAGVPFVPPAKVKQVMDRDLDLLVVDVRTPEEFNSETGHVPDALNLPVGEIEARIAEAGEALKEYADTPVFVMCRANNRSPRAAKALKKAGFGKVYVVDGGMTRWRRQRLPTTR